MSVNFSPTNWVDNSQPAITASQLNRMEKGIKDCAEAFNQSSAVYKFKGTLEYYQELPNFENEIGDTYHILETGKNYAWNGTEWFEINVSLDIEPFIQDYIVEQGTSDIWTYRKWHSGKIELWTNNISFTVNWEKLGLAFLSTKNNIPVPMVTDIEYVNGGVSHWHNANWSSVTKTFTSMQSIDIRYYGTNENGNGETIKFSAHVIGKWK